MFANMHMLAFDLEALGAKGEVGSKRTRLNLAHAQALSSFPAVPRADVVLIIEADRLPARPPECAKLSVVCIGRPPKRWLACQHDVLWVPGDTPREEVVNAVSECFWRYADWQQRLLTLAEKGARLEEFAKASQPLFNNPLSLHSASFRIIFQTFPEIEHPTEQLQQYRNHIPKGSEYIPDRDISILANDPGFLAAVEDGGIAQFSPESYPTTTLMYCIRVDGMIRAYLSIDDIATAHTARDEALLGILGDVLTRVIARDEAGELMRPQALGDMLHGLLEHKKVLSDKRVEQALKYLEWQTHGRFIAVAVAPASSGKAESLSAVASAISRALSNDCVAIYGNAVCCVINLVQTDEQRSQVIERLQGLSSSLGLRMGISEQFDDFRELFYYYQQAKTCLWSEQKKGAGDRVAVFEDYAIDYILDRVLAKSTPGVFVPDGLKRLIEYDGAKGTDYVRLLETYLTNERHISKTIRQEYLHRSTFDYRIKHVKAILGMDLDDPDVRFRLLVAFRLLRESTGASMNTRVV